MMNQLITALWQTITRTKKMMGLCAPSYDDALLRQRLIAHEGLKTSLYKDSLGYLTIGVGHLIDPEKGGKLSIAACMFILDSDISDARSQLAGYSFYKKLDSVRADVLVEMVFNIGLGGLLKFVDMLKSLDKKDYNKASLDFLNSLEAKQIHAERANDMAYRLKEGKYK